MTNKPSLKKNAIMSGLNMALSLLFPLITLPYVSRILGVENIGKYTFSHTYVSYFILIARLGINTYGARECARVRYDRHKSSIIVSQLFTINMLATAIAYILLFLSLLCIESLSAYKECILIFSTTIFFTELGIEWVYKAYEEFSYITIRNAIFKLVALVLLFILVREENDYLKYAAITAFATCGSYILNFIHSRKFCNVKLTKNIDWVSHLKPIIILSGSAIAVQIYQSSDTLMLGFLANDYQVGLYSTSAKIYGMAKNIILALLTVTLPRLSILAGDKKKFEELIDKIVNIMNFFAIPVMIGIICISDEIITIIAGERYLGASVSLKILSIAIICSMYAWISGECVLIPTGREKESFISTSVAALINILLNFVFIPLLKVDGAAITTVIAEAFVMIYCTIKTRGVAKLKLINKETVKVLIGCIGIIIICFLSKWLIRNLYIKTITAVIGSGLIYGMANLILKNNMCIMIKDKILHVLSSERK